VCYFSRKLNIHEVNYTVREKELLAIVESIKHWRCYLQGVTFTVITDHKTLSTFLTQKSFTSQREARWYELVSSFNFNIQYRPGKDNVVADALSRRPDYKEANVVSTIKIDEELIELIRSHTATDPDLREYLSQVKTHPHIEIEENLVYNTALPHRRLCIPAHPELRQRLIRESHDSKYSGHLGVAKTLAALSHVVFWRHMSRQVKKYVQSCDSCQKNKATNQAPPGLMKPLPVPTSCWTEVSMDFVTKLPRTKAGFDCIITVVDRLSKMMHLIPAKDTDTAEDVAQRFISDIFRLHGLPSSILSDRDSRFIGRFWQALFKDLDVKLKMSTSFHPQTDGQTERDNRTLEEILRHYVNDAKNDWDQHLHVIEFAYNKSVNTTTGLSPFHIVYGYQPRSPLDHLVPSAEAPPAVNNLLDRHVKALDFAKAAIASAQQRQKKYADQHRREHPNYKKDDLVLLNTKNLKLPNNAKKWKDRWIAPFPVQEHFGVNCRLALPAHLSRLHPVFHVSLLKPYSASDPEAFPRPRPRAEPPPAEPLNEETYEVEKILEKKHIQVRGRRQSRYLIKWKNYPHCDNTWEPRSHLLPECQDLLEKFQKGK